MPEESKFDTLRQSVRNFFVALILAFLIPLGAVYMWIGLPSKYDNAYCSGKVMEWGDTCQVGSRAVGASEILKRQEAFSPLSFFLGLFLLIIGSYKTGQLVVDKLEAKK